MTSFSCGNDASAVRGADAGTDATSGPVTYQEAVLTIAMTLTITPATGDKPASTVLDITARDGTTPVITDLWLYRLDDAGAQTPLTGFTSTAARKNPGLMLPALINGQPSQLAPADDGRTNGLMTNTTRGTLHQGAFVSSVSGSVLVTLQEPPTSPILVVAGVEDQRYAGAGVINADGTPGTPSAGAVVIETHTRRSFTKEVAPILHDHCVRCHTPGHANHADLYLVTGTRDELVNDNFALSEDAVDCREANPAGGEAYERCVQAISKAEFLVEPGAPALSGLLSRSRPDESAGSSANGLRWFGSRGARYNATYGDRRMPSTTESTDPAEWAMNAPTEFDSDPAAFQVLFDWVAQGAPAD